MVETVKTQADLLSEMADGGDNTAEEVRNGIVSMWTPGWMRYLDHRLPDETSHTDDDFFTSDTSADYTAITPTGTQSQAIARGKLNIEIDDQDLGDLAGYMKALTSPSAPMTIETRVTVLWYDNDPEVGLVFSDGTTTSSNIHGVGIQAREIASGGSVRVLSQAGTFDARTQVNVHDVRGATYYLRAIWVSSNTWQRQISVDGVQWVTDLFADESDTLTPTHFGVVAGTDGSSQPMQASFDYLRVYDSDLSA